MKTLKTISILALIFFAISCSKDDNSTPITADLTLDKTELVVAAPIRNISQYWWAVRDASGDNFYIHNASNTANSAAKGFMVYDVNANTFTDKLQNNSVAAAGYGSQLFYHDGTINYVANESFTYKIATNSWIENNIPFPDNIQDNHGESKSCVIDNKVFFVGGRYACKTVKYYNWTNDSWNFVAHYPIAISEGPELASINNTIYALGGKDGGVSKSFFRYDISNNSWQKLTDAPTAPQQSTFLRTMVSFKNKFIIYYGKDNKLYIYNIEKNEWQPNAIETGLYTSPYMEISSDGSKIFLLYRKDNGVLGVQVYTE